MNTQGTAPITLALAGIAVLLALRAAPAVRAAVHRSARGVVVIGVSTGDARGDVRYARSHGLSYPLVQARRSDLAAFGVWAIPVTVLVDAGGTIRRVLPGAVTRSTLEEAIDNLAWEAAR